MALGHHIHLTPHQSIEFAFITMAGESRTALLTVAQKYRSWATIDYAFSKARYESELELQQLEIGSPQIERFQKLLSALLYPQPGLRASSAILSRNAQGQSGLWAYGISGDYPICLIQVSDEAELSVVQDLIEAHLYWRKRNIQVTLVILNQHDTGYTQELYHQIRRLVTRMNSETWLNRHDGIFILRGDQMKETDRILLAASARVYLDASDGTLEQLVNAAQENQIYLPDFIPSASLEAIEEPTQELRRSDNLLFDNGYGGFDPDTGDYVIFRTSNAVPPAPWINVIANPDFGFSVSEAGGGFSWATNSSENRLTAWRNDPVQDMPGEIIYVRDEDPRARHSARCAVPAGKGSRFRYRRERFPSRPTW
jgi:cyclic beta-1,2-glucan synthetase